MDPKHITSHSLRSLLSLTEKKELLLKGIEEIENEIAKALKGAATSVVEAAEAVTPFKPSKAKGKNSRKAKASKPGGLKERILALLHDAGDQGLKVKEIADKLGVKSTNISVWFSTTGKTLVTKVELGRYASKGAKPAAEAVIKPAAPVKSIAAKPAKGKRHISPAGRAKLAAVAKARWAAFRAGKSAAKPDAKSTPVKKPAKPAKKGFKLPKKA